MGGIVPGGAGRGGAAVAPHQPQGRLDADLRQPLLHHPHIAVDHRPDIGGDGGGVGARIFLDLRIDAAGEIDRHFRQLRPDRAFDHPLMGRIEMGEDQADGDRLRLEPGDGVGNALGFRFRQRGHHIAEGVDALGRLDGARARHDGGRLPHR